MAWVPIADSGATFVFDAYDVNCSMDGSTVATLLGASDPGSDGWSIDFDTVPQRVRVTISDYLGIGNYTDALNPSQFHMYWDSFSGEAFIPNETFPPDEFTPNPVDTDAFSGAQPIHFIEYVAGNGGEGGSEDRFSMLVEVWVDTPEECNFNCECEDEYPTRTLAQMREFLMIRLGWAAMKDTPLPGVNDTLNAFLQDAQDQLHAEYRVPRLERFFTWNLQPGVRFYDLAENSDVCTKELDQRQLTWVGISEGCDAWRKLVCGIPPESYYADVSGIPTRYEIRQCIEVWPAPDDNTDRKLRIKGYFYNESLTEDTDVASIDYQAVQLYALANAKAHYGQADAANVMRQAMRYIGNMTAGAHHTRRYVPGTDEYVAPPLPVLTGYPGDP